MEDCMTEREDKEVLCFLLSRDAEKLNQMKLCEKLETQYHEIHGNKMVTNPADCPGKSSAEHTFLTTLGVEDNVQENEDDKLLSSLLAKEAEKLSQLKLCEKSEVQFYESQLKTTLTDAVDSTSNNSTELTSLRTLEAKDVVQEMENANVLGLLLSEEAEKLNQLKLCERFEVQYHENQGKKSVTNSMDSTKDNSSELAGLETLDMLEVTDDEQDMENQDRNDLALLLSKEADRLNQMKLCEKSEVQYHENLAIKMVASDRSAKPLLEINDDSADIENEALLFQVLTEDAERMRQLKGCEKYEAQYHERRETESVTSTSEASPNNFDQELDNTEATNLKSEDDRKQRDTESQETIVMDNEHEQGKQKDNFQSEGKKVMEKDDDDQDGSNTKEPPVEVATAALHSGTNAHAPVDIEGHEVEKEEPVTSFQSVSVQTENDIDSQDENLDRLVEHLRKDVKESETQTDPPVASSSDGAFVNAAAHLATDSEILKTMREERSKRLVMEQMVKIVESEANEQRYQLLAEKNRADKLEMDLIDTKAELSHTTSLAVEYKNRTHHLEESLQGARKMITNLEGKLSGTEYFKGGVDYMLETKLAQTRTTEAEKKLHGVQEELLQARNEINRLLEKLAEVNREKSEMVSSTVHLELLRIADERAAQAEKKAMELEKQLHDRQKMPMQTKTDTGNRSQRQSPMKLPELVPRPSRAHTVTGLMSMPELPDFSTIKPDTVKVLPSLQQATAKQITPLLANENSDSEGWSSEEEAPKPVRVWESPKSTSKGPLHTRIGVKLPVPAFLQNREGAGIQGSPVKARSKPPVPAKPVVAPKPTMTSSQSQPKKTTVSSSQQTTPQQQVEPPSSFEKAAEKPKVQLHRRVQGPIGRRLPQQYRKKSPNGKS